ncbi:MAG: cell division protein ZapA [Micavibrio sp.]|nr:MAG: cell division protein ZapA [Micavibrio sp.]
MGEVTITINGHSYGIFCDDGQEQRVMDLGNHVDTKIRDIARAGAANNESHLLVLTAIMLADEAFDLRDSMSVLGDEITETGAAAMSPPAAPPPSPPAANTEEDGETAQAMNQLAQRIDLVAGQIAQKA